MKHIDRPAVPRLALVAILGLLTLWCSGCDGTAEDDRDVMMDVDAPCAEGGLLRIAPLIVELDVEGPTEARLLFNNGGTSDVCIGGGTLSFFPADAPIEIDPLPDRLAPGETEPVMVRIDPETRGSRSVVMTVTPEGAPPVLNDFLLRGAGLRPEDITSPYDLEPGQGFVHLTTLNGLDVVAITDARYTADHTFGWIDDAFTLDIALGEDPLEIGSRLAESFLVAGEYEAFGDRSIVPDDQGAVSIQEIDDGTVTAQLAVPDQGILLPSSQRGGDMVLRAAFARAATCTDCERCDNGMDDDGDLEIDCNDSDCVGDPLCDGPREMVCDDGLDDDGDSWADCDDIDCIAADNCFEFDCFDGVDNDGDGRADCLDGDCAYLPGCAETSCEDGIDNDGDGLTDCADPACTVLGRADPEDPSWPCREVCDDGIDNDGDTLVDCAHYWCREEPACLPAPGCPTVDIGDAYLGSQPFHWGFTRADDYDLGDDVELSCSEIGLRDASVRWTAPHAGRFVVTVLPNQGRTAILGVLDGACDAAEVACEVFEPPNGMYEVFAEFQAEAGQVFTFVVEGFDMHVTTRVYQLCDTDADCVGSDICYERTDSNKYIPPEIERVCEREFCNLAFPCPDDQACVQRRCYPK